MKKAVIFDMDGVIVNSEPLHESSMFRILREAGAEELPEDLHEQMVGKSSLVIWSMLIERYGLEGTPDSILTHQYDYLLEEMREKKLGPVDGLTDLLDKLDENGITIAIASSSGRQLVYGTLENLKIRDRFAYIACGDEVPAKKPDPAVYLKALEMCGCSAEEAIAIEDSKTGLKAAQNAGIPALGYDNPTSGNQDISNSIAVIKDLREAWKFIR